MAKKIKEEVIEFLKPRDAVRRRWGMYIGDNSNANVLLREIIDNSGDEISAGYGDSILVSGDFNGFCFVADNGRGIPIAMSPDKPGSTQAYLSISELHSGSKFSNTEVSRVGMNGVGSSATNFLSEEYWLLSRIGEHNYNKSIPDVEKAWNNAGPRSKGDLYYFVKCVKGEKVLESAGRLGDIEKLIFKGIKNYQAVPRDFSTIVFFKPDPEIFESTKAEVPVTNLQYFLMIQEKFYNRKVNVYVDGKKINNTFKPYKFELVRYIEPKDNTFNKQVGIYVTFEVDPKLGNKVEMGSVNGLDVNQGQHITIAESCFKTALKDVYKIRHEYLLNGLRVCVILLAGEVMFDSQTKTRLKSITKVKVTDFGDVVKDMEKIMKKNSDYWDLHVSKLNKLAESMKDIGAAELAEKMMDGASGVGLYRSKNDLVPGFAEATGKDRMACELFLCFTGDTEILTCNNEKIALKDLVGRIENGEELYTFSCDKNGNRTKTRIIAAEKIKSVDQIVEIRLNDNNSFRCTLDHKILLSSGEYVEAQYLTEGMKLMSLSNVDTVVDIEIIDAVEDVYCLEVDNPLHNFPLASGVFAKNCEGLSAAGSLVTARPDTTKQAVLPLRGKILNVTNASAKRAMESQTIYSIFKVIGLGLDVNNVTKDCNTIEEALEVIKQKSRYGKIIISSDADPDGDLIATELLYLFSKFARFMIELGLVYRAISPLWKGKSKTTGKVQYYYPDDEYDVETGFPVDMDEKCHYSRFKGLGSLSPETGEVEDIFFNESTRRLIKITPDGIDYSRALNEDINERKKLLTNRGILTNPYNFKD